MRIHTALTYGDVLGLPGPGERFGGRPLPVTYEALSSHGSRIRPHAFNVRLAGSGGRNNTGLYGAGDYCGATWDEWGGWFGRLFALDPSAVCGGTAARPVYDGAEHFHWTTGNRFVSGQLPPDTHPRHRWHYSGESVTGSYAVQECQKCTAYQRWLTRMSWADFQRVTA